MTKRQLKKPGYIPLLMMRTKGLLGTVMGKHANQKQTLSKSAGSYIQFVGGEGDDGP